MIWVQIFSTATHFMTITSREVAVVWRQYGIQGKKIQAPKDNKFSFDDIDNFLCIMSIALFVTQ